MKVLILGISGLIGHNIYMQLSDRVNVIGTLHKTKDEYANTEIFSNKNVYDNIDMSNYTLLKKMFKEENPDVIVNCVGITRRKIHNYDMDEVIYINSTLPHLLAKWSIGQNKRIIHFSTDCVFDGVEGNYLETSHTNAFDIYGKTKALGELSQNNCLTIRSSFIGQELFDKTELLDWFLSQDGQEINGYTKALYSGVSTIYLARLVNKIIMDYPKLTGLFNLAPIKPISKYDLLSLAKEVFSVDVSIRPDDTFVHNPTLNGSKLHREIGIKVPSWDIMMHELASNRNVYDTK
jgi:dTDP-4-dehydrorhamnose reductase